MLLGYLFCFKVTDQIKYSINESLIILDMGLWISILKSNVSLECQVLQGQLLWLAFGADQRISNFKISLLFEFVSSSSMLLIISRVRHVLYGDLSLIMNKGYSPIIFYAHVCATAVKTNRYGKLFSLQFHSKPVNIIK